MNGRNGRRYHTHHERFRGKGSGITQLRKEILWGLTEEIGFTRRAHGAEVTVLTREKSLRDWVAVGELDAPG